MSIELREVTVGGNKKIRLSRDGLRSVPVDYKTFKENLISDFEIRTGLLPPGIKWISPGKRYWLYQSPPRMQSILFHNAVQDEVEDDTKEHNFDIFLPWTVTLVEIDATYFPSRTWVWATTGPITSEQAPLRLMPLPNHYVSALICYPEAPRNFGNPTNVAEAIQLSHELTWSAFSNIDITATLDFCYDNGTPRFLMRSARKRKPKMLQILKKWEESTPQEIMEWVFPSGYDSIAEPEALLRGHEFNNSVRDIIDRIKLIESINLDGFNNFSFGVQSVYARSIG